MNHAIELLKVYGYVALFLIVFLDQVAVSIPSPPFVVAMGVLSAAGRFDPLVTLITVFGAASLADMIWYRIGRSERMHGARQFVSQRAGIRGVRIINILSHGTIYGLLAVKFSLVPSALPPFLAGSMRISGARFVLLATFANVAWTSIFFFGGFLCLKTFA